MKVIFKKMLKCIFAPFKDKSPKTEIKDKFEDQLKYILMHNAFIIEFNFNW